MNEKLYDTAVVGGGLAGLCLSIQLSKAGHSVILFEKETYPFHKVCGEYISMESFPFVESLGLPLSEMNLPIIKNLQLSAPNGNLLQMPLPLGGFGISRYKLDAALKNIAEENGVTVLENTKVNVVDLVIEEYALETSKGTFRARSCAGTFGKKSNLDVKWKRPFIKNENRKLNSYAGFKYHIKTELPSDIIALHNFKDGYCGVSKIEEGKYCLCYLTHIDNLKKSGQSIKKMEENILADNPFLKKIFTESERLFEEPVSISQISFLPKSRVHKGILLLGDAAGMISPLCGNGMSMAMHASKIAAGLLHQFLKGEISRTNMEERYLQEWNKSFSRRLKFGRWLQYFFGKAWVTNFFIGLLKKNPKLSTWLIRQTHGQPF